MREDAVRTQSLPASDASRSFDATISQEGIARFVLEAPCDAVRALGGIDPATLRELIEDVDPEPNTRRAILVPLEAAGSPQAIVEQIIAFLAATAVRAWPVWYTDVDFAHCTNDRLGRRAAGIMASSAAKDIPGASPLWAERAAPLALEGKSIRDSNALPEIEIAQIALAINRTGLTIVVDAGSAFDKGVNPSALIHALEWTAKYSGGAVLALFDELPASEPPLDRILFDARRVASEDVEIPPVGSGGNDEYEAWLAPWRGRPHPMSEIEKRLAIMLSADTELGSLFVFNQTVHTVRGTSPKVDLVWNEGRLAVEIDGYESHGNRRAFIGDRQRDYELTMSGYTVLRLTNDEMMEDLEKAVDKIRDLVRLRQARPTEEM